MLAQAVVTLFQQRLGGQYSRARLLSEINNAQTEILGLSDVPICRVQGDVYLVTSDGVTNYTLPMGIRSVTRIFSRSANLGQYNLGQPTWVRSGDTAMGETDYTFYCVDSPSYDVACEVQFPASFNPGDTTDFFLMEQYRWPETLWSEAIPMTLPDQYVTSLLYYMVKARVEEAAYGVDLYNDPKFQTLLRSFQTKQANASKTETYVRKVRF